MRNIALLYGVVLLLISGCRYPSDETQRKHLNYFDIRGYFDKEVARLTKAEPLVIKTVQVNGSSETKKIKITDWGRELAAFSDADINRASWDGEFKITKIGDREVFTSNNEKVPVKKVSVIYKNSHIVGFEILIKNNNSLYSTVDSLFYYPDSLYTIKKAQNIRLLAKKSYTITGRF